MEGLDALLIGDWVRLTLDDGICRQTVVVSALELAEALARLEEPGGPTMPPLEMEDEPDDIPDYTTAELSVEDPSGVLVLRRIKDGEEIILEINVFPSVTTGEETCWEAAFQLPYYQAVHEIQQVFPW